MLASSAKGTGNLMSGSSGVAIVGGCGHVGLPLGLAFASRGLDVTLYDVNEESVAKVNAGTMPFDEPGAPEVLARVVAAGHLRASADPRLIADVEHVVVVIGTPIDEHLNPNLNAVPAAIGEFASYLHDGQLLVLRSTVYPGVTALVERLVADLGLDVDVAFCPERIADGKAMVELFERREPIDIVTVAESRERKGELDAIGGRSYLSSLSNQTPTAVHAVQYARIV